MRTSAITAWINSRLLTNKMSDEYYFGDEAENYKRLFNNVLLTALIGCGIVIAGVIVDGDMLRQRLFNLVVIVEILILGFWFLQGSIRSAAAVLIGGFWVATSVSTIYFAGVHSANFLLYAFIIFLAGWILGRQWLLAITAATIALVLGLGVAELLGFYRPTPRAGVMVVTGTLVGTLVAISFLTTVAYGSLIKKRNQAMALSEEMRLQNLALAQGKRDLQLVMDHVPAGIASFDAESRLRFGNARYAALFGAKPEEIAGKHVSEYVPKAALDCLMQEWQKCLGGERAGYRRNNIDPLTAKIRIMDVELVPEFDQGQVVGLFALLIDVTEQVAAEENIRELNDTLERRVEERTVALEEAMDKLHRSYEELAASEARATLSTLIASVTHELHTPIGNSVMAASTLGDHARRFHNIADSGQLKRSDIALLLSVLREGTDLLQRNLQRAEGLLQNFRQVAADQASEQRRSFDLATVVREILDTLAPSLKRHPHRVVVDVPAGITMDSLPGPLGQVLINLINNAYMHAFEGRSDGVLTIGATNVEEEVVLSCADNGVGIPAANIPRLFQPFFSTRIGRGGTGLGMSIAENLVRKALGGTIEVRSEVGVGTTIDVRIPLIAPALQA